MELDRVEKGQERVVDSVLAGVVSNKTPQRAPGKGKVRGVSVGGSAGVPVWGAEVADPVVARAAAWVGRVEIKNKERRNQMPARNGTGPMGLGPLSGRGMGYCAGVVTPGTMTLGSGRGWGRGSRGCGMGGGGRGWRNRFIATGLAGWQRAATGWPMNAGASPVMSVPTREQELAALKNQAANLETAMGEIRKRIQEFEIE
ncbi:MAG: DUF5320 domain-containing protein [Desulfuromonadales bacterium]|nr:DUF5320 domain-containing protein [Desulfuromonadales bacterium]